MLEFVTMALYSLLLGCVLILGSPYWLWRAGRSSAGRQSGAGLRARLGRVPRQLLQAVSGRQVVWLHAVSVGEVLAATRLVTELERALGDGWAIVVSTTTATAQALARQRFAGKDAVGDGHVFYYPLDFAWAVRAYLRAVRPRMLVLMESELWPRMLEECRRAGIPVAVVNARVSDRSFRRGMRVRALWSVVLGRVNVFLAQTEEDARRLVAMGARAQAVRSIGNLKYDAPEPTDSEIAHRLKQMAAGRPIVVAGSTVDGEEPMVLAAWRALASREPRAILVIAVRHPERFQQVHKLLTESGYVVALASRLKQDEIASGSRRQQEDDEPVGGIILLDTIGDLAAVYGIADVAFVGGSLVRRGGHNPLEPARFGVPVVMGPSYENFRDIVSRMQSADGIRMVQNALELEAALSELLRDREFARAMGLRGQAVFQAQQGATGRAVQALMQLLRKEDGSRQNASATIGGRP